MHYHLVTRETGFPPSKSIEGLLNMKLVVRIFALSIVIAGAAAASVSSSTTHAVRSHQSATERMPIPACGPYVCPPGQNGQ